MPAITRGTLNITRGRGALVLLAVVFVLAAFAGSSFRTISAGAAVLVRQAHLDWTPDMVRTAFINTSTTCVAQSAHRSRTAPSAPTPSSRRAAG